MAKFVVGAVCLGVSVIAGTISVRSFLNLIPKKQPRIFPAVTTRTVPVRDLVCLLPSEHFVAKKDDDSIIIEEIEIDEGTIKPIAASFDIDNLIPLIAARYCREESTWSRDKDNNIVERRGMVLRRDFGDMLFVTGMFDGREFDPKSVNMFIGKHDQIEANSASAFFVGGGACFLFAVYSLLFLTAD